MANERATALQAEAAFALAHFAATAVSVVAAAIHRGKPIDDDMVKHLLKTLAVSEANAPEETKSYFRALADALSGKHYEAG